MAYVDTLSCSFIRYVVSEEERIAGTILTTLHKQLIQNQIAEAAESKLNLKIDPSNPLATMQQEAELHGRILALKYLIDLSNSAELELQQAAQQPQGM